MNPPAAARFRGSVTARPRCPDGWGEQDLASTGDGPSLIRSARAFAAHAHAHQRRPSDDAPFIEHPLEVACLLRAAGCSDVVVAAGLLHDVIEDTVVGDAELTARFGADVAALVRAVSDDARVSDYRERKRRLREQVRRAGGDAAVLFAADKICKVRELDDAAAPDDPRMEHYRESLQMLQHLAPHHPLVHRLADALADHPGR